MFCSYFVVSDSNAKWLTFLCQSSVSVFKVEHCSNLTMGKKSDVFCWLLGLNSYISVPVLTWTGLRLIHSQLFPRISWLCLPPGQNRSLIIQPLIASIFFRICSQMHANVSNTSKLSYNIFMTKNRKPAWWTKCLFMSWTVVQMNKTKPVFLVMVTCWCNFPQANTAASDTLGKHYLTSNNQKERQKLLHREQKATVQNKTTKTQWTGPLHAQHDKKQ